MTHLPALFAILASCLLSASAQSTSNGYHTYTFGPLMPPNGVQSFANDLDSVFPLVCELGCYIPVASYLDCTQQTALPNGQPLNTTACTEELCSQAYFDQLSECLNCIVSNGNNRAPGYHTNTSITAYPPQTTTTTVAGGYKELKFPLIDSTLANQMLQNISGRCQSTSSTLTGATTVTATPTTTGPYYTSWTSGQVLSVAEYTGLTRFTSDNNLVTSARVETVDASGYEVTASASGATASAAAVMGSATAKASSGAAAAGASTTSSATASASSTSAANRNGITLAFVASVGLIAAGILVL